jgi:tetratricopeptide (TPR) repeat protein
MTRTMQSKARRKMTQTAASLLGRNPITGNMKEFDEACELYEKGQFALAREILEEIVAHHPDDATSLNNLAACARHMGDLPKAAEYALRAVKLDPTSVLFMHTFGAILLQMARYDEAAAAFCILTQLEPLNANTHNLYGIALRCLERWDEAIVASLRAIDLDPTLWGPFDNLAMTLIAQGDYEKAVQLFQESIRLAPNSWVAWHNFGSSLNVVGGRTAEAADVLRKAIALDPHQPQSHMNISGALLKLGDFENGWREYEYRWQCGALATVRRPTSVPQWDGSASPRTLLLHAEQGLGDTLQFCRYAPLVAARGHHVILEVQRELSELVAESMASEYVTVVPLSRSYPSFGGLPPFDAHCPLMSLPLVLGTRLDTVPGESYLRADPARSLAWRERVAMLGDGMRVGLVWAGSPRRGEELAVRLTDARRSTTLATLAPLLEVPGVSFVSLQKGAGVEELRSGNFPTIYDADPELHSFADTAALVANLDLVICVDTSVSHLVGGMGKPVWMLSRYDGCFRWLEDRADSPWYPSMRIFRQGADRKWEPVVASVAKALAELTQTSLAGNSSGGA